MVILAKRGDYFPLPATSKRKTQVYFKTVDPDAAHSWIVWASRLGYCVFRADVGAGLGSIKQISGKGQAMNKPATDQAQFKPYIDAGLPLLSLYPWNAKREGKELGKRPRDNRWTKGPYNAKAAVERAKRDGSNVGFPVPEDFLVWWTATRATDQKLASRIAARLWNRPGRLAVRQHGQRRPP